VAGGFTGAKAVNTKTATTGMTWTLQQRNNKAGLGLAGPNRLGKGGKHKNSNRVRHERADEIVQK
jgi:hypothetical protein